MAEFTDVCSFTLLAADYSQIEFRILAHMSQDRHLLDFFNSNNDIHSQIASRWLAKPIDQVSKQERDYSKRIVYGILYGMGMFRNFYNLF